MLLERRFRAMGTDIAVWLWTTHPDAGTVLDALPAAFEAAEQELSRFRKDSGLSKLNRQAGKGPQPVSEALAEVCGLALEAAKATDGLFDPTILPALLAAGYDDTFAAVSARMKRKPAQKATAGRPQWDEIAVRNRKISVPAGAAIDLGGIAKGWMVDRVAESLRPFGPSLVDAGGDVRATGKAAGLPWPVAVADPQKAGHDLAQVELTDEALVTSSVARRRWQVGDGWMHHIIDPRTQRPSGTDLVSVTVLGDSAAQCEVQAKVALLLGAEAGLDHLAARGASALLLHRDGSLRKVGTRFAEPAAF